MGSTVPGCVSPAHDSCDNSHLSVGDNDSSSLSPSVTDIDLYWITASFDHIDLEIEEGVVHRRTWWKQSITIGDPARFGWIGGEGVTRYMSLRHCACTSPALSSTHSHPLRRSIAASSVFLPLY